MTCFLASSPLFEAFSHSDFFGKLIFLSLFLLSVLSWAILAYKIWLTHSFRKLSIEFYHLYQSKKENLFSLEGSVRPHPKEIPNPFYEIYKTLKSQTILLLKKNQSSALSADSAVYLSDADIGFIESHVYTVISSLRKGLESYLFILSTVVSLAPFLGLLGTVWGILITLKDLQAHAASSGNDAVLVGLSMALGTTVLGLVVAIPALVAYNYLQDKIRDFEEEMEEYSSELLAEVELLYRKVDAT